MNNKMSRRQKDIKSKLMAAIAMLLVSSIMMVSTTYAWFTLSTAPEVTGISTSVGANGNLEMALLPADALTSGKADYGITSGVGDSAAAINLRNTTWGNLVDLGSDELARSIYGLDQIKLYPSELNVTTRNGLNPATVDATVLKTPAYGADGRVSELKADTFTSLYDSAARNFPQKAGTGVRAVGTAAGMTDRQLAYRNARSAASTAMVQAKTVASQSLNTNGASLGNLAVTRAMGTTTYEQADVNALLAIVDDLLGSEGKTGVLQYVENAYKNYIIATGASKSAQSAMDDLAFAGFSSVISGCSTLEEVKTKLADYSITLPDQITGYMDALIATKATVKAAQTELQALTGDSITWEQLATPLNKLADMNKMTVNGYTVDALKENLGGLISDVTSGKGVTVTMASGGGVYADIADHCGNYTAAVVIEDITYNGIGPIDMNARMETDSNKNYLPIIGAAVEVAGAPEGGSGQTMPITDMYGYIIDLAFRTNAAESNLLLQTTPVDRIYTDNKDETADTMGAGSTMTFTATTMDFDQDQMVNLMDAIRIVFMDTANNVYATAKLDTAAATKSGDGMSVTASIYLYEMKDSVTTYEPATENATHIQKTRYAEANDGNPGTHFMDETGAYVKITEEVTAPADATLYYIEGYDYEEASEGATHKLVTTTGGAELIRESSKAVITALTQNQAKAVSALVYLDGNYVTNADVAATAATSMTGTMNLQFASSANLVPMNYTPLMNQGGSSTDSTEATTPAASEPNG